MEQENRTRTQNCAEAKPEDRDSSAGEPVFFEAYHQPDLPHVKESVRDWALSNTMVTAESLPSDQMKWKDSMWASAIDPALEGERYADHTSWSFLPDRILGKGIGNHLDTFQNPCCSGQDCYPVGLTFDKCVGRFLDTHLAKWGQSSGTTTEQQQQVIVQIAEAARAHINSWRTAKALHGTSHVAEAATFSGFQHHNGAYPAINSSNLMPEPYSATLDPSSFHSMPLVSEDHTVSVAEEDIGPSSYSIGSMDLPCVVQGCNERSKGPYSWKRHQAKHFPRWACMPYGTHIINHRCGICGAADVTEAHRDTHPKLDVCLQKPLIDRSYRGLDKLCDHLKVHLNGQQMSDGDVARRKQVLKLWESDLALDMDALWCQRCELYLDTWSKRQEHVLEHLKQEVCYST